MTDITPTPLRLLALAHGEDAANLPDLHLDPRDFPCDILRQLDDVYTLGDSIPYVGVVKGVPWTGDQSEAFQKYSTAIGSVQRKVYAEFDEGFGQIAFMLARWQNDPVIRFVIFSNKDNV